MLSRADVNRNKVRYVLALRAVLHEMCKAQRTPESLRAAEEVETELERALSPSTL